MAQQHTLNNHYRHTAYFIHQCLPPSIVLLLSADILIESDLSSLFISKIIHWFSKTKNRSSCTKNEIRVLLKNSKYK